MNPSPAASTTVLHPGIDPCQPRTVTPEDRQRFAQDGIVMLRHLVRREFVTAMAEEVMAVVKARSLDNTYLGQSSEYLAGSVLDRWINSPNHRRLVEDLLQGPAGLYLPFTAVKGPRQIRFAFHQDNQYTPLRGPARHIGCNVWVALVPMTVANGCLQVVPGSHTEGILPAMDSPDCPGHRMSATEPTSWVDCVMEPGDAVVFDRNNVHGSGPNTTDAPRIAYAVQWHRHDTEAFFQDSWELLRVRPRWPEGLHPVTALTSRSQRGE